MNVKNNFKCCQKKKKKKKKKRLFLQIGRLVSSRGQQKDEKPKTSTYSRDNGKHAM